MSKIEKIEKIKKVFHKIEKYFEKLGGREIFFDYNRDTLNPIVVADTEKALEKLMEKKIKKNPDKYKDSKLIRVTLFCHCINNIGKSKEELWACGGSVGIMAMVYNIDKFNNLTRELDEDRQQSFWYNDDELLKRGFSSKDINLIMDAVYNDKVDMGPFAIFQISKLDKMRELELIKVRQTIERLVIEFKRLGGSEFIYDYNKKSTKPIIAANNKKDLDSKFNEKNKKNPTKYSPDSLFRIKIISDINDIGKTKKELGNKGGSFGIFIEVYKIKKLSKSLTFWYNDDMILNRGFLMSDLKLMMKSIYKDTLVKDDLLIKNNVDPDMNLTIDSQISEII